MYELGTHALTSHQDNKSFMETKLGMELYTSLELTWIAYDVLHTAAIYNALERKLPRISHTKDHSYQFTKKEDHNQGPILQGRG